MRIIIKLKETIEFLKTKVSNVFNITKEQVDNINKNSK